jgi:hypothetical protein
MLDFVSDEERSNARKIQWIPLDDLLGTKGAGFLEDFLLRVEA